MTRKLVIPNLDELIERYQAGMSLKQLSDEAGIVRTVLQPRFIAAGVKMRSQSDAERLKWSVLKRDRAAVERQCTAAWQASRRRKVPRDQKLRTARTRYLNLLSVGRYEEMLTDLIVARGLSVEQQFPVGPYNLDLAVNPGSIAVEVFGSSLPKKTRTSLRKRTEHILDAGWFLVFVHAWKGPVRLGAVADQVVTLSERMCSTEPTMQGRYWVVRSDGDCASRGSAEFQYFARIVGP